MSSSSGKIITRLRQRRQIEADLRRLLDAESELELQQHAREIATRGREVIPAIVGSLDRAEGPMLAALGMVAAQVDRGRVQEALFRALQQPRRGYRARMGAVMILERYLGVQVADDLRPGLAEATGAALASLAELLDRSEVPPALLADMVQALDQQEPDVVLAVVGELQTRAGARPVELLRMLAQDVREEIAGEALQALGGLHLPEAARALQTLIPAAAPSLRPMAERLLRKLRFSGVEVEPLPPPSPGLRALIGPVDGQGQRLVWFIGEEPASGVAQFLSVLLSDGLGAVEAVGHARTPRQFLPPRGPVGTVHRIRDGAAELTLVEEPFDLGRGLLAEGLEHNREAQIPLPGVLRLLGAWLWGTEVVGSLPRGAPGQDPECMEGES